MTVLGSRAFAQRRSTIYRGVGEFYTAQEQQISDSFSKLLNINNFNVSREFLHDSDFVGKLYIPTLARFLSRSILIIKITILHSMAQMLHGTLPRLAISIDLPGGTTTMILRPVLAAVSLASVLLATSVGAHAQTPPPGALADLGAIAGFGTPTPFPTAAHESFTFAAGDPFTTVSFAFREVPAFFALSNVSVRLGGGPNLLVNPNFEGSVVLSNIPNGWGRWIQPIDVTAIGVVASHAQVYGCGSIVPSQALFWCDGSVQGYDAIFQSVATTVGSTYTIGFDLADNGGSWSNPGIDMLVYALNGLNSTPAGTTTDCPNCFAPPAPGPSGVPEPASIVLLGLGLAGLAFGRRKKG